MRWRAPIRVFPDGVWRSRLQCRMNKAACCARFLNQTWNCAAPSRPMQQTIPLEHKLRRFAMPSTINPKGKPILARNEGEDMGATQKALLLGIDLGTSRSSIVSMHGARKTVDSYV